MRAFIFLLCTTVFGFNTINGHSQHKITIKEDMEISVDKVFNIISKQTQYSFLYPEELFKNSPKVKLKEGEIELKELLKYIFSSGKVNFRFSDGNVIIIEESNLKPTKELKKQDIKISGTVTDKNGQPLPSASVIAKGIRIGTTTDFDGNFTLTIPDNAKTLVVSFIGFKTKEIPINGKTNFTIVLKEDTNKLEEVVVIGYGKQSKAKVTGSIGKINAKELAKVNAVSLDQQLAGKMSGVIVNQSSGQPGAASNIIIRGVGTLTAGTNPLIVVNGYPLSEGSSLNSINPNDIENISVLKDAASAAIYGSRAANGVILVTTKKGNKNGAIKIAINSYGGFQKESSGVKLVDAYQFAQFIKEARNWGYMSKDPNNRSATDPNSVRVTKKINGKNIDGRELSLDFLQPYLDNKPGLINTNWKDIAFRDAPIYNYDVSITGGSKKTNYYASLGYFDQEGIVIGTGLKRYSASVNLKTSINDKIDFGINLTPSFTVQNSKDQTSRSSGALALMPLNLPYYSPYKADGSLNISDQITNEQRLIEGVRINGTPVENLLATSLKVKDENKKFRTFGNMYLNAKIFNNLSYKLSLGGDYDSYTRNFYYPSSIGSYRTPAPRKDADGSQTKTTRYNFLIENTLNYHLKLDNHTFNLLAGYTFQRENISSTYVKGTGYADNNIQSIAGASAYIAKYESSIWALESYLARVQYDYRAKYLFSAAIRSDGSSRFGENNRWGYFPSVSGGWVFTKEDFFPSNNFINYGKISASWGKTGNNQIGNYSSRALVTPSNYVFGNDLASGYTTTTSSNPNLGWEIASSMNIGISVGLFHKINVETSYYKTNTSNLLLQLPIPQQTGYNTVIANVGEMENKGFEFEITGNKFAIGNVNIGFRANLTTYKNTVLSLGAGKETPIATGRDESFITKIGHPVAEIYGYDITGIYKTQSEISNSPHLSGTLTGDYMVRDVNGDGKINTDDKVSKGTYLPDFTYGFGANVTYKGFNFSFDFTGIAGRTLMDGSLAYLTEAGEGFGVPTTYYFEHRYHPVNNPNGFLGQPNFGNFSNSRKQVRTSVVTQPNNGDYLRLRNIRLAYNLPNNLLKKIKLSALQLYISGNNVFTATKFRGWNPDGTSSNILTSGYTKGTNYPIAKTFTIGTRIEF
ncbi:MAG: SusC/RagA family TonB-linked outer membrane protein [Polaribacter sp.]